MSVTAWYPKGGASGPVTPTSPWDQVRIGGKVIPCHHARITAAGVSVKEDPKGGLGQSGARPTFHGFHPEPLSIEVFFSTLEQVTAFASFVHEYKPATPYPVESPQIDHLRKHLNKITIKRFGALLENAAPYRWKCTISCKHWLPPAAASKRTATTTPTRAVKSLTAQAAAAKANPKPSAAPSYTRP